MTCIFLGVQHGACRKRHFDLLSEELVLRTV